MRRMMMFAFVLVGASAATSADHVRGYTRSDGTYVAPHYRTAPDDSRTNNYSSQGNINPYNGREGRIDPFVAPRAPSIYDSSTTRHPSTYDNQSPHRRRQ